MFADEWWRVLSFDLIPEGEWWDAIPRDEWPAEDEKKEAILRDFSGRYGDRKQEIVFIGIKLDRKDVEAKLDACLLTDDEMAAYRAADDDARPELFPSDLRVRA